MKFTLPLSLLLIVAQCTPKPELSLADLAKQSESIVGNVDYLQSPFVTAGDRVYMVGHQDGKFPDLGWHIDGEMGGIWDHPIKLMDGFSMLLLGDDLLWNLGEAERFTNFSIGNLHTFKKDHLEIERFQFVPEGIEGIIVELTITNHSSKSQEMELVFTGHVDLRPTWLAERQGIEDGLDEGIYEEATGVFMCRDTQNPWFVSFGSDQSFGASQKGVSIDRKGKGRDYSLERGLSIAPKSREVVRFFIAGSYESEEKTRANYASLVKNPLKLLKDKIALYEDLQSQNQLTSDDPGVDQLFRWTKYNTQWLVRDVPEVGRGVSAGIPDYPWWFGTDNAYILQGMASAGLHQEALATIDLILGLSRKENGNGKVVHEVSSNGVVFNPGNLNTTPTFIHALWKMYTWTGDKRIIDEYYEDILKGIEWIDSIDKDDNGYPDGAGMMEIHGLHSEMIDVVAYLAQAYRAVANFALAKGEDSVAFKYQKKYSLLADKINSDWWVDGANSYADFRSSKEESLELIDAAIIRADTINKPWSVQELTATKASVEGIENTSLQSFVVHHNWVVNTPMEVRIADDNKAKKALATATDYRNRFGMFVTGIDRNEDQEKAEKWKAFSYVGAVMTLPTGVQAISEANYGNVDNAYSYLKMLENSFSYALPGSMYEVSPDFGMMAQGWNIYAVAVPIVDHFFGIKPFAHEKKVILKPQMPSQWNEAKLEKIRVGYNELTILFERKDNQETYKITQKLDWEITFEGTESQVAIIE